MMYLTTDTRWKFNITQFQTLQSTLNIFNNIAEPNYRYEYQQRKNMRQCGLETNLSHNWKTTG